MKKVRKSDLKYLIADFYREFVDYKRRPANVILEANSDVQIHIKSFYIIVCDVSDCSIRTIFREDGMKRFSEALEAISFGNLKVTKMTCEHENYLEMYIANVYEVIEE